MFIKTLNIQLARAIPLNPYFWRLHTAIGVSLSKNLGIPFQKILHVFLTQGIIFLKNEQVIPLKSP